MANDLFHAYIIHQLPKGSPRWQVIRVSEKFNSSIRSNQIVGYAHRFIARSIEEALLFAGEKANEQHQKNKKLSKAKFYVETTPPNTYTEGT